MATKFNEVDSWLKSRHEVHCRREWLEACLSWITKEAGHGMTLMESVYEQWLHTDLRESSSGCLPSHVFGNETGEMRGRFVLQVDSVLDVGAPVYAQLQQLKGAELDEAADHPGKSQVGFSIKPSRMLFLTLTDGCGLVQGMEYQLIPGLSVKTPPGAKIVIDGCVQYRLGVILLVGSHVTVLGGSVEELVVRNNQRNVLTRSLNLSDDSERVNIVSEGRVNNAAVDRQQGVNNRVRQQRGNNGDSGFAAIPPVQDNQQMSFGCERGPDSGRGEERLADIGEPDWDEFCDFTDEMQSGDIPGPSNDIRSNDIRPSTNDIRPSTNDIRSNDIRPSTNDIRPSTNDIRSNDIRPSTNDIRSNNIRPSTNDIRPSTNNPLVLPVDRVFAAIAGKPDLLVYTKACVRRIEGELTRGSVSWSVGATIADSTGELPVTIGNGPIEILTGFTLNEFKSKSIPTVQMRQGLLKCHRTLLSLDCVMELQWINGDVTVTRLLDVT